MNSIQQLLISPKCDNILIPSIPESFLEAFHIQILNPFKNANKFQLVNKAWKRARVLRLGQNITLGACWRNDYSNLLECHMHNAGEMIG